MNDLISRQSAVSRISDLLMLELKGERIPTWNEVYRAIQELPSSKKHGKWIKDDVGVHCSECFCGWEFLTGIPVEVYRFNYCPHCGAHMA